MAPTDPVNLTDAQREMWRNAWREISREPTQSEALKAGDGADDPDAIAAGAANLLDADLQLQVALKYLRDRLGDARPDAGDSTTAKRTSAGASRR